MASPDNLNQAQSSRKRPSDDLVDPSLGRLRKAVRTVAASHMMLETKAQRTTTIAANHKSKLPPHEISPPHRPVQIRKESVNKIIVNAADDDPGVKVGDRVREPFVLPVMAALDSMAASLVLPPNGGSNQSPPPQSTGTNSNVIPPDIVSAESSAPPLEQLARSKEETALWVVDTPTTPERSERCRTPLSLPYRTSSTPTKHATKMSLPMAIPTRMTTTDPTTTATTATMAMMPRSHNGTNYQENHDNNHRFFEDDKHHIGSSSYDASPLDRVVRFIQFLVPLLFLITSGRSMAMSLQRQATPVLRHDVTTLTLREILTDHDTGFHLAMAPAFFGFYGYFGALAAWYEVEPTLPIRSLAGASAGAMAAVLIGAGIAPQTAADFCADITLPRFADFPGVGAIFRGHKFENLMDDFLRSATNRTSEPGASWKLQEAIVPLAVTAFDLQTLQGKVLTSGSMARAARASATFPLLFEPVGWVDSVSSTSSNNDDDRQIDYIFIDGGIADPNGLVGLTKTLPLFSSRRRVVNLSVGPFALARPPFDTATTELISISIEGLPLPGPWAMSNGPRAFAAARESMRLALDTPLLRRGDVFELSIVHASTR